MIARGMSGDKAQRHHKISRSGAKVNVTWRPTWPNSSWVGLLLPGRDHPQLDFLSNTP